MVSVPTYDDGFFDDGRKYFADGLPVWRDFVLNDLQAKSIADFGCGQGDWLEPLRDTIDVWGCDGFADEARLRIRKNEFLKIDIGQPVRNQVLTSCGKRDVVMSLEAMEHVTNDNEVNFLDNMLCPDPRVIVLGVASGWGTYDPKLYRVNRLGEHVPGGPDWHAQFGRHHVNCQPVYAVVEKMATRGYVVDEVLSSKFSQLRVQGKGRRTKLAFASFYRKNTRVYVKG